MQYILCRLHLVRGAVFALVLASTPVLAKAGSAAVNNTGNRFGPVAEAQMTAQQRELTQRAVADGWSNTDAPLVNVLSRMPEVGLIIQQLGMQLQTHSGLSSRQQQIAALMAAKAWGAGRQWSAHREEARRAGLSPRVIAALELHRRPDGLEASAQVIWDIADELLYHRQLSDRTFAAGMAQLGDERLVNATMLVTFYELVGMLETLDTPPSGKKVGLRAARVMITPLPRAALGEVPTFEALAQGEGPSSGQFQIVGGRFRPMRWSEMGTEQRQLADQLLASWRHSVSSVFIPLLRSPTLALVYEPLGSALSPRTTLMDTRIRNFATLVASREWRAQFEYWAAHRNAVVSGMTEEQVAAISAGIVPSHMDAELSAAYQLCEAVMRERQVSDRVFANAIARLGERNTVGTVIMLGFYGMVASQTEALDRYPMPTGIAAELPEPAAPRFPRN